jgi:uncharacterized protein (TIGR02996 family)
MPPAREGKAKGTGTPATAEQGFLKALKENPEDTTTRLVYADWLEEQGRTHEALQQRVKAGVSEIRYKLRRKTDGLFSEGADWRVAWSAQGRVWSQLGHLKAHLTTLASQDSYGGTPWGDLEVVVFEVRTQAVAVLPVAFADGPYRRRAVIDPSGGNTTAPAAPAEETPSEGRKKR